MISYYAFIGSPWTVSCPLTTLKITIKLFDAVYSNCSSFALYINVPLKSKISVA